MIRIIALVAGVCGACVTSQAPEFTQQYQQRLAGQVDALTVVVMDFDRSALEAGLGREEALGQMVGTPFLEARQRDMRRTFARHAVLADHLAALRAASPLARLAMPHRVADAETLAATWSDYTPAVPLSQAGAVAAAAGGGLAWFLTLSTLGLFLRHKSGERRVTAAQPMRREPVVARPAMASAAPSRLPGAVR